MHTLVLLALLFPPRPAAAQVVGRESRALGAGLVTVTTEWREERGQRHARAVASAGGREITLHDGATVRTAIASSGEVLLLVLFHGGEHPFARAITAELAGGRWTARPAIEIARDAAAARPALRPAAAIATASPGGFTILLQEQDTTSPQADVVTTLTRIGLDGSLAAAPAVVAIPWALAAIASVPDGYELAVLYGGGDTTGRSRICLVALSDAGAPREHPWWAAPNDAVSDVQLLPRAAGGVDLVWRRSDGRTIASEPWPSPGGWAREAPEPHTLAQLAPGAPFAAVPAAPDPRILTGSLP